MYESLTHFQRSAFSLVFIVLVLIWVHGRLNRLNERLIYTYMSNLKLHEPFPVKKNEKNEKKNFQNFWPPPRDPRGTPYLGPQTEIPKTPRLSHEESPERVPCKISVNSAE